MFWKREPAIIKNTALGPIFTPPMPAIKEFETMYEILRDAEKFHTNDEKQTSFECLEILKNRINELIESKK